MIIVHPRLKKSKYSSIDTMSKPNRYCTNADPTDPVCPPMWNCPLPITMTTITPSEKPMKMKTDFEERTLRQPINPFPDGDPDLAPRNINAPGSTAAGKSDDDSNKVMCRICGPRIEGVIGVPNPDPAEPWPARNADGSEQNPFTDFIFSGAVGVSAQGMPRIGVVRSPGNYSITPINYSANNVIELELDMPIAIDALGVTFSSDANAFKFLELAAWGVDTVTIYLNGETIVATWASPGGPVFFGILSFQSRDLPTDRRIVYPQGETILIVPGSSDSGSTGNTSATLNVEIGALGAELRSLNIKDNLSRGRGYEDQSILVIKDTDLGGVEGSGAIICQVRTTHWPDEDVSTCIVPEQGKEDVARQYCCFEDSLTGKDWAGGEGRCASLAQYNVARPEEWPQHCPDGFEYAPGDDGLFCKKCATGTSTFDPALSPANCPADGVGCQKCCEDPGVSCP